MPGRDNVVLYVSVSSAVTCLLIVFRDYNINVRPLQQTVRQAGRQAAKSMRRHDFHRVRMKRLAACRAPEISSFYKKKYIFNRRAAAVWIISLHHIFSNSALIAVVFKSTNRRLSKPLIIFTFFLFWHFDCFTSFTTSLVAQTGTLRVNLIRFNSSPIPRPCFYVFCKYLFSRRYVLYDAIYRLSESSSVFGISVFILNYFQLESM